MTLPLYTFNYARQEGKAKLFFDAVSTKNIAIATLITLIPAFLLLHFRGIVGAALAGAAAYAFAGLIKRRIDGITGDTLGAVNEIAEIIFLIVVLGIGK